MLILLVVIDEMVFKYFVNILFKIIHVWKFWLKTILIEESRLTRLMETNQVG